jgi:hypothetical protein
MNASKRWAYHFVAGLECVKCRRKGDLTLYHFDGRVVNSEEHAVEELRSLITKMDVWCPNCTPRVNTRVAGQGRLDHKQEAARMADIRVGRQIASRYDEYVIEGGTVTKQELLERVKDRPCAICGGRFDSVAMDLYNTVTNKAITSHTAMSKNLTIHELVQAIEQCVVVCANCHRLITNKVIYPPKVPIILDGNFWSSVDH